MTSDPSKYQQVLGHLITSRRWIVHLLDGVNILGRFQSPAPKKQVEENANTLGKKVFGISLFIIYQSSNASKHAQLCLFHHFPLSDHLDSSLQHRLRLYVLEDLQASQSFLSKYMFHQKVRWRAYQQIICASSYPRLSKSCLCFQ